MNMYDDIFSIQIAREDKIIKNDSILIIFIDNVIQFVILKILWLIMVIQKIKLNYFTEPRIQKGFSNRNK